MERAVRPYLTRLAAGARRPWVRVYAFATELVPLTPTLRREGAAAFERLAFPRGTRIAAAIEALLAAPDGPTARDDVLVVSDGWEAGGAAALQEALLSLRRRSRRLIWWNPDAALPGFRPLTTTMRLVTRIVDEFGSGLEGSAYGDPR
jgi:uncharacterized protein with von Willebrand factor type A (vWA) domain